jgi:hypothetical protein
VVSSAKLVMLVQAIGAPAFRPLVPAATSSAPPGVNCPLLAARVGLRRAPMIKAIRTFVRQRSRHTQQTESRVAEVDDTRGLRSDSEVPLQLSKPQLEEPFAQPVWGKVKWYNPQKRYGFVELSDGSGDAFLHATALEGSASAPCGRARHSSCGWLLGRGLCR